MNNIPQKKGRKFVKKDFIGFPYMFSDGWVSKVPHCNFSSAFLYIMFLEEIVMFSGKPIVGKGLGGKGVGRVGVRRGNCKVSAFLYVKFLKEPKVGGKGDYWDVRKLIDFEGVGIFTRS